MRLCADCHMTPWPYLLAVFISGFVAFLTWLTLEYKEISATTAAWLTAAVFCAVLAFLLSYMVACMRRHCGHDGASHHHG